MESGAYVSRSGETFVIGNGFLERVISVRDGVLSTIAIRNKLAGETLQTVSSELQIGLGDGRRLTNSHLRAYRHRTDELPEGGVRLSFFLRSESPPVEARVAWQLFPKDFYLRKTIGLRTPSRGEAIVVRTIEVERFTVDGRAELGGYGQPIFVDGAFFLGLEYPAGYNESDGSTIVLRHHPGRRLTNRFVGSKSAVFGVAPKGEVEGWFMDYVRRIRIKPRSFVLYNSWYDAQAGDVNERNMLQTLAIFRAELLEKRGVALDSFVLDHGWQNPRSIWDVHRDRFPNGLGPLAKRCHEAQTQLGLWMPLTPENLDLSGLLLDLDWGEKQGYEVSPPATTRREVSGRFFGDSKIEYPGYRTYRKFYCLSQPKYQAALRRAIRRYVRDCGVNFLKHDFAIFDCRSDRHSHLPGELYAIEANIDAAIEVFDFTRKLRPDIYRSHTSGVWPSPWWLMHVDSCWMRYGLDYGQVKSVVALEPRDWTMTYRDSMLYANARRDRAQFPISAFMTGDFVYAKLNMLGGPDEPLDRWTDDLVLNLGRGIMLRELYISPDILTPQQWDILAKAIQWARHNTETLAEGHMVLGQPDKGEVYGYSHFARGRGILCLRNPSMHPQAARIALTEIEGHEEYVAEITYPYRQLLASSLTREDSLRVELEPYQVAMLKVYPRAELAEPVPLGCRYQVVERAAGKPTYDLWAEPGHGLEFQVLAPSWAQEVVVIEGLGVPSHHGPAAVDAEFDRKGERAEASTLSAQPGWWRAHIKLPARLGGPGNVVGKPKFVLLAQEVGRALAARAVRASLNGKEAAFSLREGEGWQAFAIELTEAESDIDWSTDPAESFATSAWLFLQRELAKERLTITYEPAREAEPRVELPTPFPGLRSEVLRV